jgi:single-stranded DNA-binding protein
MNSIILAGHVGNVKFLPPKGKDGAPMMLFDVADNVFHGQQRETIWWRCKLWGERAGRVSHLLHKGTYVAVAGRLSKDDYVDKAGVKVTSFQIWVDQLDIKNDIRIDAPIKHDPSVRRLDEEESFEEGTIDEDDDVPF